MNALARGIRFERARAREHPGWVRWTTSFADWLLTQQKADGSFPAAWRNGTGVVADRAGSQTKCAVAFLIAMSRVTGRPRYQRAALRAGRQVARTQGGGDYFGGTIDQGNIVAKEAAGLALEAFLALWHATGDRAWLRRARDAAAAFETWTYLWDVPMPVDADPAALSWKPGVPTTGVSAVAANGSGADQYSQHNLPELVDLAQATGDRHLLRLARLLLHNQQAMLALPGRTYDLVGPGWQQEFFQMAEERGTGVVLGRFRAWVPWVSAVKLRALLVTERRYPKVFERLAARRAG